MAFLQDAFYKVKDMANSFLTGRQDVAPRASYYANEEDAMVYQQPPQPDYTPQEMGYAQPSPQQPMDYHYQRGHQQPDSSGYQRRGRSQSHYQDQQAYGGYDPRQQNQPPQQSNVAYFPNTAYQTPHAENPIHVERVVQMVSREDAYNLVTHMMNRESIIVSCESIASAQEVQRCIDLLLGAAYALGYELTQLSLASRVYLISPSSVKVICDEASGRINGRNPDGTPMRVRNAPASRRSRSGHEGYTQPGYDSRGDYQEYSGEGYEENPYQQRREHYGRPTYQSAAI